MWHQSPSQSARATLADSERSAGCDLQAFARDYSAAGKTIPALLLHTIFKQKTFATKRRRNRRRWEELPANLATPFVFLVASWFHFLEADQKLRAKGVSADDARR
jgi:hypothetical protein